MAHNIYDSPIGSENKKERSSIEDSIHTANESEAIYTISSCKELKLKRVTKFFINNNKSKVLIDFCIDHSIDNTKLIGRMNCFVNYINHITQISDAIETITILIRGYWIPAYYCCESINLNDKIILIVKKNTIDLPNLTSIPFIKII